MVQMRLRAMTQRWDLRIHVHSSVQRLTSEQTVRLAIKLNPVFGSDKYLLLSIMYRSRRVDKIDHICINEKTIRLLCEIGQLRHRHAEPTCSGLRRQQRSCIARAHWASFSVAATIRGQFAPPNSQHMVTWFDQVTCVSFDPQYNFELSPFIVRLF